MADITAIILTKNEEQNILLCINSIKNIVKRIIVIDSFSTDKTVELARGAGAEVYQHTFENHSKQFKYGLYNFNIETKWVLRLDADESLTNKSAEKLDYLCNKNMNSDINGIINVCTGRPEKLADRVEKFIQEKNYPIVLKYRAFPDRPYDSKAIWGDNFKISIIEKNKQQ